MMELLSAFFRNSLFASVMILAVLAVRPLLRKAPRNISCLLWLLVALRLLLPFQLESPLSLQPDVFQEPAQITVIVEPDAPPTDLPVIDAPQQLPVDAAAPFHWETLLPLLWICGALSLLIYSAVSYCVLKHRVQDAVKASDGAWESDRIEGAFLLGYFLPKIYIPIGLHQQDREFILAHERSHQRRGDHWWKLLGMLCLSIHWYNPLVWLSYALLCRDIETACDEQVIHTMELEQRRAYSFALLNSGKRISGFLAYPVAFGEISLKQRIKDVLSYRKPGIWVTLGAVILAAVIVVCFMTTPAISEPVCVQKPPVSDVQPEDPVAPTTEAPTLPTTEPPQVTTLPTEPVTEPTAPATEPTPPATEPTTKPEVIPTQPKPTEPKPTQPKPTEPKPTQPKPAEPKPTEPVTAPAQPPEDASPSITVIAQGGLDSSTVRWKITSDGVLTIWGNRQIGPRGEYGWSDYKDRITAIVVEGGVRNIPKKAFWGMSKVTTVQLPKTVTSIGEYAFYGCSSLSRVTIPYRVKKLEAGIFQRSGINSLTFVGEAPTIDSNAFKGLTATVYYHAEYDTWKPDQLQNYGGAVTWTPV